MIMRATKTQELLAWLGSPVEHPLPKDLAHDHFLLMHPRIAFLKNLPLNSIVLDLGCGDGQLRNFKDWLGFTRPDLKFIGVSLGVGEFTHLYDEFHVVDIDTSRPELRLAPTHVIAAQFLEHVRRPAEILGWLSDILPHDGTFFVDWPSDHTRNLPRRQEVIVAGYDITTLNFFDDPTHKNAFPISEVIEMGTAAGFRVISSGYVDMPYIAESLKAHGINDKDQYLLSMAIWLKTRFVSYVCFVKTERRKPANLWTALWCRIRPTFGA